ncbi:MAG TPA: choline dehydrogenase [Hyphomicrobiales bacterium]|nr:choline dehydrogenase [Hyphomicrobiales bacterium]
MSFDYVIVGGGSAGCVLANRLSADPAVKVALLEAGPADKNFLIHMPAGYAILMKFGWVDWGYHTEPQTCLHGRKLFWPRGKVLGGSSSVNAMVYTRGVPSDYDLWAQLGNRGWSWSDVLPYFRKAENYLPGTNEYHGGQGPLKVSRPGIAAPLNRAWVEAGQQAGYPYTDDFNGAEQEGFGPLDCTHANGRRSSAAVSYLRPVLGRPNLTVITGAQATRVLLEKGRAAGVEYAKKKQKHVIFASSEIILSAGTINSPQLLLLSGIGPADEISARGIAPIHHLPGVGKNLQDHIHGAVKHYATKPVSLYSVVKPTALPRHILYYLLTHKGPAATMGLEALAFVKSRPELLAPDLEYHFAPVLYANHGRQIIHRHGFMAYYNLQRPEARGEITLKSANPLDPPAIQPNYLQSETDLGTLREGFKIARRIFSQEAFDPYRGKEFMPGPSVKTDAEIDEYHRATVETIYHPVGTCKMGQDDMAVVDETLRVRGIEGLRVADASIMPRLISGNTNAPTIMIAEKAADMIAGQAAAAVPPADALGK